jgi:hypothetical protein
MTNGGQRPLSVAGEMEELNFENAAKRSGDSGRPRKSLEITEEDRGKLNLITRRPKSSQAMALRARLF